MIVTHVEITEINRRVRPRRVLELPVQLGPLGETKRCHLRKGGVYKLTASVAYAKYRREAEAEPDRRVAVLRLIDRCDVPIPKTTITVREVERHGDSWLVRFLLGDHRGALEDRDVYLSKYGDYTTSAKRQAVQGDPPLMTPFAEDLEKARRQALERRFSPHRDVLSRMHSDAETLAQSLASMKARNRAKVLLKEIEKLSAQLSVEQGATVPLSVCAASPEPAAVEDGTEPSGTESDVSLQTAA